ncbi:MAG: methyltransferase domain-containing protein [Candidatus Sumerlaeia bacterium]|nr:methyltransferase domain-containing protein [Candidatus Sumerlaeia bacterium]
MDFRLRQRCNDLELMDQPHLVSAEEMVGCLQGLRRVNRLLGGVAPTTNTVMRLLQNNQPGNGRFFTICDVGCGAGDIPIAMANAAKRRGIPVRIMAVENNPDLAKAATRATNHLENVDVVVHDARPILLHAGRGRNSTRDEGAGSEGELQQAEPFDIVTASLFLHHFVPGDVVAWMRLMAGASRVGVVINDLERHPLAWAGIKVAGPFLSRNRVFLHDAPLSVRRAYTPGEWRRMVRKAGWRTLRLQRRWAWRVILTGR